MPSATDFFNEVRASNIRLDTLIAATNGVHAAVDNAAGKMDQSIGIELTIRDALIHQIKQNETIICLLKQIADSTCQSLNEEHLQTGLQTTMRDNTTTLADLYSVTHAEAALIRERELALKKQIEACCPPPTPASVCNPKPCPEPEPFMLPVILIKGDTPRKGDTPKKGN